MKEIEFFTDLEVQKILDATTNEKHRLQILIMADCGLRVSEVTTLKWTNCNFQKREISLTQLKGRGKSENNTLPMSQRLYNGFNDFIEKTKTKDLKGYIFPSTDGEPIGRGAINKMLKNIESQLPEVGNIHPHRFRHSLATKMLANGAELHDIRNVLGHQKVETTLIYAHTDKKTLLEKIEGKNKKPLINRLFGWILPKKAPAHINLAFIDTNFVIGRNDELALIQSHIQKGLHIVLVGPRGVGKSHLLDSINFGKKVIELDNTKDFKKSLLNIILWLFNDDKETAAAMIMQSRDKSKYEKKLQTESIPNLITIIRGLVERNEYILKVGTIDDITPAVAEGFKQIKEHFQIVTTSQKLKQNVFSFISNFEKVEIKPLDRTNALKMFYRLTDDLQIENQEFTKNKLWEVSEGNPKIIFEIADRMRKEPVLSGDVVEDICNNYLGRSIKEIDLSLFLILIFGGLMVFKFVLKSNGDVDARAIGGLISIIFLFGRFFVGRGKRASL